MKQIITGPMGRVVYYNAGSTGGAQYPAMDVPDCSFAGAENLIPANHIYSPNVVQMPRRIRSRAAVPLFGAPLKRNS